MREDLLARIRTPANRRQAWPQVKANPGAPGVEGRTSEDCPALAREHWPSLRQAWRDETSQPSPVRRTESPKRHGPGKRVWGIPPVVERVSPPASAPGLGPLCDPDFSASSCGLRPGRSAPQAVRQIPRYLKAGYRVAVDLDLAQFFDRVNHAALRARGARTVRAKAV